MALRLLSYLPHKEHQIVQYIKKIYTQKEHNKEMIQEVPQPVSY